MEIFKFTKQRMAPYKRPRIIQFVNELPQTVSGKIKRISLRKIESNQRSSATRNKDEYFESDFWRFLQPADEIILEDSFEQPLTNMCVGYDDWHKNQRRDND